MITAARAALNVVIHGEGTDDFRPGQGGVMISCETVLRQKGHSISAHKPGNIRTYYLAAQQVFQCSQYGVVIEGSSLYDNLISQFRRIVKADYLIQRIFDNRVRQACRNISNGNSILLRFSYTGVHENSAAGT